MSSPRWRTRRRTRAGKGLLAIQRETVRRPKASPHAPRLHERRDEGRRPSREAVEVAAVGEWLHAQVFQVHDVDVGTIQFDFQAVIRIALGLDAVRGHVSDTATVG